jgi:hypothetical protein
MLFALPLVEMLHVNPQLVAKHDYNRDVLHCYVNQNLPWFNICQEIIITTMLNAVAQGEGEVYFLDDLGGSGKTFVYNVLLASIWQDEHVAIEVTSFCVTTLLLEGGWISHFVFKIPIAIGRDSMCSIHV